MRTPPTAAAIAIGAALVSGGCGAPAVGGVEPQARAEHTSCGSLGGESARCYYVAVPENRSAPQRTIDLRIVVLPAVRQESKGDPIFYLAGGPGQAATDFVGDRSLVDGALRQNHDVVFADQRGTGESNPLTCRFYGPPGEPQTYFREFLPLDQVRACRATLERSADLSAYTTAASVEDLDAIRAALGYSKVVLVGGSYGTRLAMEYVRRYGDRVRAVVLEGPVTPANHIPQDFGRLAQLALDALFAECDADAECKARFPKLRQEAAAVFERIRREPVTATVVHPSGQRPTAVTITRDHVVEAIRYMMYSSAGASHVPEYLHEAFNGNYSPFAQFLMRFRAGGTFDGLYISITCAEDVPFVTADAVERDEPTYLGSYRVRQQRAACAEWPRGTAPADSRLPVTSKVPVLIIAGLLDPVTPPANGDTLARTLPNSLVVRVPFGGHSPYGLNNLDCLDRLKEVFIEKASVADLDTSCVARITRQSPLVR